jgi:putative Holliday junction resolvase
VTKRWLGIDLGDARIGLALSDQLGAMAHPYKTVAASPQLTDQIAALARQEDVGGIVLGLPKNMDGTLGPAAAKAKAFADQLRTKLPDLRLVLWDERLTTVEAQRVLHAAGRNVKQSRRVIDQVAAQILLQNYLDAQSLAGGI